MTTLAILTVVLLAVSNWRQRQHVRKLERELDVWLQVLGHRVDNGEMAEVLDIRSGRAR